jgi:hypothetical protein
VIATMLLLLICGAHRKLVKRLELKFRHKQFMHNVLNFFSRIRKNVLDFNPSHYLVLLGRSRRLTIGLASRLGPREFGTARQNSIETRDKPTGMTTVFTPARLCGGVFATASS